MQMTLWGDGEEVAQHTSRCQWQAMQKQHNGRGGEFLGVTQSLIA